MSDTKPEEHVLANFPRLEWIHRPAKDAFNIYIGMGVLAFVPYLLLMIFIPFLRNFFVFLIVLNTLSACCTIGAIIDKKKRDKVLLHECAAKMNEIILELTGGSTSQLSVQQFQAMIGSGKSLPLLINGVPGAEIRVAEKRRFVVNVKVPDYGIRSFDLLLSEMTS